MAYSYPVFLALIKTLSLDLSLSVCSSTLPLPTMRLQLPCTCCMVLTWHGKFLPAQETFHCVMKEVNEDAEAEATRGACSCPHCPSGLQQNPRTLEERRQLSSRWDEPSWHFTWPAGFRFVLGTWSNIRGVRNHFELTGTHLVNLRHSVCEDVEFQESPQTPQF